MALFWTTQGTLNTPVIGSTKGDGLLPYLHLPGTQGGKSIEEMGEEAETVYGVMKMTAPKSNPTVEEFLAWHPLQQLALLEAGVETTIGSGTGAIHVIKSTDGERLYFLDQLQKRDIATMPLADQNLVAGTSTWLNVVSVALDMVPSSSLDSTAARKQIDDTIAFLRTKAESPILNYYDGTESFPSEPFTDQLDMLTTRLDSMGIYSITDINAQLDELGDRLDRLIAFFDVSTARASQVEDFKVWLNLTENYVPGDTINKYAIYDSGTDNYIFLDVDDFKDDDAMREYFGKMGYWDVHDPDGSPFRNTISLDENASNIKTRDLLIKQEKRLAAIMRSEMQLIDTGSLNGQKLDGMKLVAMLQLLNYEKMQSRIAMDTEVLSQINQQLQILAEIQDIINQTLQDFDPTKTDQKRGVLNIPNRFGDNTTGDLTLRQLRLLAMFDATFAGEPSPIEKLIGSPRPTLEFVQFPDELDVTGLTKYKDLYPADKEAIGDDGALDDNDRVARILSDEWSFNEVPKTTWDIWATRISEHTSIVSQRAQIEQQDQTTRQREANRAFDQANAQMANLMTLLNRITS